MYMKWRCFKHSATYGKLKQPFSQVEKDSNLYLFKKTNSLFQKQIVEKMVGCGWDKIRRWTRQQGCEKNGWIMKYCINKVV